MLKLEYTEKYVFATEDEALVLVEKKKLEEDGVLLDYKLTLKETKDGEFWVLVTKQRLLTLSEAKEKLCV